MVADGLFEIAGSARIGVRGKADRRFRPHHDPVPWPRSVEDDAELTGGDVGTAEDAFLDGAREDVDATHVEHVVGPAGHTKPPRGTAARAGTDAGDDDHVAGAIAQERLAFLLEMRADELARRAFADRQRIPGGVEQLREYGIAAVKVQIVGVVAWLAKLLMISDIP